MSITNNIYNHCLSPITYTIIVYHEFSRRVRSSSVPRSTWYNLHHLCDKFVIYLGKSVVWIVTELCFILQSNKKTNIKKEISTIIWELELHYVIISLNFFLQLQAYRFYIPKTSNLVVQYILLKSLLNLS